MVANVLVSIGRTLGPLTPGILAFLGVLLMMVPFRMGSGLDLTPLYPLIVIFYFGPYRAGVMTPVPVFAAGLFQDLMTGAPLGLWAMVYLAAYGVALLLRDFFGGLFRSGWPLFTVIVAVVVLLAWGLGSAYAGAPIAVLPLIAAGCITAAIYPLFAMTFAFAEHRFGRI